MAPPKESESRGPGLRTTTKILIGLLIGAAAGVVQGAWGSARGMRGMLAAIITIGLVPLALDFVVKRTRRSRP